jgi:hypothetical protein
MIAQMNINLCLDGYVILDFKFYFVFGFCCLAIMFYCRVNEIEILIVVIYLEV